MEPPRILHISTERTWRGGEQQIAYLLEECVLHGLEVMVVARKGSAFAKWSIDKGIPCREMSLANGLDMRSALKLKLLCAKHRIQLVHVHSGKGMSIVYLAFLSGLKVPVIVHRRVDFALRTGGLAGAKYNHRNVRRIICVSEAIAQLVRQAVQRPERVITVYSGIDFDRFSHSPPTGYLHKEFQIDPNKALIINISALAPHKDYFTFIDTVALVVLKNTKVHFLAVGEGPLREELEVYARTKEVASNITFTGFRTDVPLVFREAALFLITSSTEGLGTSIIDAMYNGLPVVATRAGGIPELIEHGLTGLMTDIGHAEELSRSVLDLLSNESLRREIGARAHQAAKRFGKELMARQVIEVYREILALTPAPPSTT